MIIEPTPQERARDRNAPTRVVVETITRHRVNDPSKDSDAFEQAATKAATEASEHGYEEVAFVHVAEFISARRLEKPQGIAYRYAWEFTAHTG